jgi:GrpB-like predicted nucleotidyltransferase (UPF0157 family)
VPGLAAKPIIDLMALVAGLDDLDRKRSLVEALRWSWHGKLGITGRRYCACPMRAAYGSPSFTSSLRIHPTSCNISPSGDYLRAHREVAHAYEEEKRRARDLHLNDSHAYTDEKDVWIRRIEADALSWFVEPAR